MNFALTFLTVTPRPARFAGDMAIVSGFNVFRVPYGLCRVQFLFHVGMASGGFEASRGIGAKMSDVWRRAPS